MSTPSTQWNGARLAEVLAKLAATSRERPGMSSDLRVTLDVDRELWERILVLCSVVEHEREQAAAPPAPPPHEEPPDDGGTRATVTQLRTRRPRT